MNPTEVTVCQTKQHYDTEWEAILAANRVEDKYGEPMGVYQCWPMGHWHITHKIKKQRRGVGSAWQKCEDCGAVVKRAKFYKHRCSL